MKKIFILFFIYPIILFIISSFLYSDIVREEHKEDQPIVNIKLERPGIPGSGFVQSKPDTPSTLSKKLAEKAVKYIEKYGKENAINLFTKKYRKFRKYNTYLFVLDMDGNVLAHTGNANLVDTNLFGTKDFMGNYFIQNYINKIKLTSCIDYANLFYNKKGNLFLIQYIHLELIDENCFLGTVAVDKY